jgi:tetratricopeptide (TPR) repeat protein
MRLTLLSAVVLAAGLMFAVPSRGETIPPGGADDTTDKKLADMQEIKDAVGFFQNRDLDNALKKLEEAAKKNADLPPPEIMMADISAQANLIQAFWTYLDKAAQKYPDDPETFVMLGNVALQQRRMTEADLLFNKAYALVANFNKSVERRNKLITRILNGMAIVAESREDWAMAQQRLEEYLKQEPKNVVVLQRIGQMLFKQKKAKEALQKFKEAYEAKTAEVKVLPAEMQLAILYAQYPDADNAKKWAEAALKSSPKDANALAAAANIYLMTGDFEEAKKRADEAIKVDEKSADAKALRALIALFLKDYQFAADTYEKIVMDDPKNFGASDNLALALIEMKEDSKKKRALDYAEKNAKTYEKTKAAPEAFTTLAWVLYKFDKRNNLEQAYRLVRQVLDNGMQMNPDAAYYCARILVDKERPKEAQGLLQQALKSTVPWTMKEDAKKLYEDLTK